MTKQLKQRAISNEEWDLIEMIRDFKTGYPNTKGQFEHYVIRQFETLLYD